MMLQIIQISKKQERDCIDHGKTKHVCGEMGCEAILSFFWSLNGVVIVLLPQRMSL